MRNSRGVARKHPTSVLADRNGRSGSSLTDQSYYRTYSSRSSPFSSRLGTSVDPALQQHLVSFDKMTEELFIQFTQKQREELNAFDRQWISEYGYELEATSHYLDIRNVEVREEIQRKNERLIRLRSKALNSFKRRQKQELQEFYNKRMRERNEIVEASEIEPSDTVMSIIRNRSGFQVFPRSQNFSQSNSQFSTKTRQIKVDIKKKNSKPSFIFSKTKFEDKDITIGRFKPKKKPKKEEDPNLLDIDNLTKILSAQNGKMQRIQKEKELDETCNIHEFGELLVPSGLSSAYISAAGSDSSDELSLQSGQTNVSIATSAYELQVERFMRQEEKTNNEINEFIQKQDILIQMQNSQQRKDSLSSEVKNDDDINNQANSLSLQQNLLQTDENNQKEDTEYNDSYSSESESNSDKYENDHKIDAILNKSINDKTKVDNNNNNNKPLTIKSTYQNPKESSEITKSFKPATDVEVNIFTKGLSSTSSSDGVEEQHVMIENPFNEPENSSRINNNSNYNTNDYKRKRTENTGRLTVSKKSRTINNIPSAISSSLVNYSKKGFTHSQTLMRENKNKLFRCDDDTENLSSGKIKIIKNHKNKESSSIRSNSKEFSRKYSNNASGTAYNASQGKQQFAFRTTLEMGVNAFSTSPMKLDKQNNDV